MRSSLYPQSRPWIGAPRQFQWLKGIVAAILINPGICKFFRTALQILQAIEFKNQYFLNQEIVR
jgi:hypothetical protein